MNDRFFFFEAGAFFGWELHDRYLVTDTHAHAHTHIHAHHYTHTDRGRVRAFKPMIRSCNFNLGKKEM